VSFVDQPGVVRQQRGAFVPLGDLQRVAPVSTLEGVFGGACKRASPMDWGRAGPYFRTMSCETGLSQLSRCYALSSAIFSNGAGGVMTIKFALARLLEFGCAGSSLLRARCPFQKGVIIFM
jgi:hypothetical protein